LKLADLNQSANHLVIVQSLMMMFKISISLLSVLFCFGVTELANGQSPKKSQAQSVAIMPAASYELDTRLNETSDLLVWNDTLWTHNDSDDNSLYAISKSTGAVLKTIKFGALSIYDWEAVGQDGINLYLGDIGNNGNGIRKDLKIFKVEKASIGTDALKVDTIAFSYPEQTNFSTATSNNTDFDCEAFIVTNDSIYLFTKQWVTLGTAVYSLPKTKGEYKAKLQSNYMVSGLITSAVYLPNKNLIVLTGYTKMVQPFFYILNNFTGRNFFGGNKTRLNIDLPFHQIEGVNSFDGSIFYVTNELLTTIEPIPAKLHTFNLAPYITSSKPASVEVYKTYPNPLVDHFYITNNKENNHSEYLFHDLSGRLIANGYLTGTTTEVQVNSIPQGVYVLKIVDGLNYTSKLLKRNGTDK
jgi:hypothetical protein